MKDSKATEVIVTPIGTSAKRKTEKKAEDAFCCYVGPSIIGAIQFGTLYPGDKASVLKLPAVKIATEKHSEIAQLIVSGEDIDAAKASIKTQCGPLYRAYKALTSK